ncbi:transglutaminase domain-containing protein [Alicyclobacillus fodiniaquatilis]|uniref:Transglutaminase domain-containing protein n=1 Tax=Alicyclobacillus fodiniaquatilis TaxID=1661150 RepID=A0ABW4JF83_9BACL
MKKRLIISAIIALGALVGLTGCGQASATHHTSTVRNIGTTSDTISIETKTGTQNGGVAQVTLLSSVGNYYQYALPIQRGQIDGTITVPWSGKTSIEVTNGPKMLENVDATVKGAALSEQQLDLLPSYLMDSNIPTVAQQAHAIASSVTTKGTKRNLAVASVTMQWVKQHIHTANQTHTARADQTLATRSGGQASRTALAVALLRADNIPARAVGSQTMRDGMYGTSYSVDAWLNGKWLNIGTP